MPEEPDDTIAAISICRHRVLTDIAVGDGTIIRLPGADTYDANIRNHTNANPDQVTSSPLLVW